MEGIRVDLGLVVSPHSPPLRLLAVQSWFRRTRLVPSMKVKIPVKTSRFLRQPTISGISNEGVQGEENTHPAPNIPDPMMGTIQ